MNARTSAFIRPVLSVRQITKVRLSRYILSRNYTQIISITAGRTFHCDTLFVVEWGNVKKALAIPDDYARARFNDNENCILARATCDYIMLHSYMSREAFQSFMNTESREQIQIKMLVSCYINVEPNTQKN